MVIMGTIDLLRLLIIMGLLGSAAKGIMEILPQLWNIMPYLSAALLFIFAILALSVVTVCIFFGIRMRRLASRVRERGIKARERNLWSKALAIDLFSSLVVGALLSALGLALALLGVMLAPITTSSDEEKV